jgi:hypothetical protein
VETYLPNYLELDRRLRESGKRKELVAEVSNQQRVGD